MFKFSLTFRAANSGVVVSALPDGGVEVLAKGNSVEQDESENGFEGKEVQHNEFGGSAVLWIEKFPEDEGTDNTTQENKDHQVLYTL